MREPRQHEARLVPVNPFDLFPSEDAEPEPVTPTTQHEDPASQPATPREDAAHVDAVADALASTSTGEVTEPDKPEVAAEPLTPPAPRKPEGTSPAGVARLAPQPEPDPTSAVAHAAAPALFTGFTGNEVPELPGEASPGLMGRMASTVKGWFHRDSDTSAAETPEPSLATERLHSLLASGGSADDRPAQEG